MFKRVFLLSLIFLLAFSPISLGFAQSITKINTVRVNGWGVLDDKGNMSLSMRWIFPTSAMYIQIKNAYPNPYVIARNLLGSTSSMELRNAKVYYDDANNSLKLTTDIIGASANRRKRWEVDIGKDSTLVFSDDKRAIFFLVQSLGQDAVMIELLTINLPKGVSSSKFDASTGIFSYNLDRKLAKGNTSLNVLVKVKPRIMSALYKAYGNSDLGFGSYWIAKSIFTNTGNSDITELKISYQLGEYSSWSPENVYTLIVPGGSVVDLYYPIISSKISDLKSPTLCDLSVKYSYKDSNGKTYSDTISNRLQVLGINQFEFSNLTEEEKTGTWIDAFSNTPLLAAFVTKLDDAVKAFAGMVSQVAGGAGAALNDKDALAFCKALYELEVYNGISYQTPSGFLVDYQSGGQDIKYPRDTLRDKAGTCVDLAILYASVCETVGLKTLIVTIPGHAFPVVILPSGQLLPVESTGLGGAAVGQYSSFDQAVEVASKELKELQVGRFYIVEVDEMQKQGVLTPELPKLPGDILKQWGYKSPVGEGAVQVQPQPVQPVQPQPVQPQPQALNISGQYQGTYKNNATGAVGNINIVLAQTGGDLQGQIEIVGEGQGNLSGKIMGANINFTANVSAYYGTFTVNFIGVIQGNSISGNYTVPASGITGTFVLSKIR